MIKNVAYFPSQAAQNSKPVLAAVLEALAGAGIAVEKDSYNADAAIIWSALWAGKMLPNQAVYEHYRSQGKPVIIIEVGALNRGVTWKVAVNNITSQGYYGHTENLDYDRPNKLGIKLLTQSVPSKRRHVIVAAQHKQSLQVAALEGISSWINDVIAQLKLYTDRPIVIRPHPRSNIFMLARIDNVSIESPKRIPDTYDSFDMMFDCHAIVNYNSGPGIQAAIAGVRPIVDSTSLAAPVGIAYADIEKPYECDRSLWLTQICHTEYTLEELRKGTWLKRIEPALTV